MGRASPRPGRRSRGLSRGQPRCRSLFSPHGPSFLSCLSVLFSGLITFRIKAKPSPGCEYNAPPGPPGEDGVPGRRGLRGGGRPGAAAQVGPRRAPRPSPGQQVCGGEGGRRGAGSLLRPLLPEAAPSDFSGPPDRALSVSVPAGSGRGSGRKAGLRCPGQPWVCSKSLGRTLSRGHGVCASGRPCLPSGRAGAGEERGNQKRGGSEYGLGDPERPASLQRLRFPMDQLWASAGHDEETETRRR